MQEIRTTHTAFKTFRKDMRDIWESFNLVQYYMTQVDMQIKNGQMPTHTMKPLYSKTVKTYSKNDTLGAISHVERKANRRRVLIEAVSRFENYLGNLVTYVYKCIPEKLQGLGSQENNDREVKLINIILASANKEEILDKIIEEKVRGIFYGNPVDFFEKDKAKIQLGSHFKDNFCAELLLYKEITARRNTFIHNDGKVDRKYLREVIGTTYQLGQSLKLQDDYLRGTVSLLEGLCAETTAIVIEKVFNGTPKGMVAMSRHSFRNAVRSGVYSSLLSNI